VFGLKVEKKKEAWLHDGTELSFGSSVPSHKELFRPPVQDDGALSLP
jgi:hypothetical protein